MIRLKKPVTCHFIHNFLYTHYITANLFIILNFFLLYLRPTVSFDELLSTI